MRGAAAIVHTLVLPALLALLVTAAQAQRGVYPLDELRPGQRGYGITVLEGSDPDTFAVEIVGVMAGNGPGQHLVLVRALDARFERTGIAAGMSGSPIYIDGRLAAALAYAYVGATEPIGGAVPFEEMHRTLEPSFSAALPGEGEPWRAGTGEPLPAFPEWRERCRTGEERPIAEAPGSAAPAGLRRLELPLAVGGVLGDAGAASEGLWAGLGLRPLPALASGGGGDRSASERRELRAGDALAVELVSGDMDVSAIGTVTWREGERVLAFGHGFVGTLPIEVPVSRARIHTIIPTRGVSFKVGEPIEEIGTLIGDREIGVSALLGRTAPRVPLTVRLESPATGVEGREFHFRVARNEIMTPALVTLAARSALTAEAYAMGASTLASRLEIRFEDGRTLAREDLFRTLSPGQAVAEALAPLSYVAASDFAPFSVAEVTLALELAAGVRAAEVIEIAVPRRTVAAGDTLSALVRLRHHRGEEELRRVPLRVPSGLFGEEIVLMVGSPEAFYEWDRERAPEKYTPRSFEDLLRLIEEYPSEETLIVRLFGPSRGAVHLNRELSSLPLSKWGALIGGTSGDRTYPVAGMVLAEQRIPLGEVVLGGAFVTLTVKP